MSVALYMDEHVQGAITHGLRDRGVNVLTVQEDGWGQASDPAVLDRAGELGRAVFSRDADFLREATRRQRTGEQFVGVVYAHQLHAGIGKCISDLETIAAADRAYRPHKSRTVSAALSRLVTTSYPPASGPDCTRR